MRGGDCELTSIEKSVTFQCDRRQFEIIFVYLSMPPVYAQFDVMSSSLDSIGTRLIAHKANSVVLCINVSGVDW